jgi:hypothetical protein
MTSDLSLRAFPRRLWRWLQDDDCSWLLALLRRLELPRAIRTGPLKRRTFRAREDALRSGQLAARSIFLAVIALAGGLCFAIVGDFVTAYLAKTGLVWFAVVGIGWVTYWGGWADQRLRDLRVVIEPAFADGTHYETTYSSGLSRIYKRLWPLLLGGILAGILWGYVAWGMFHRGAFTVLPSSWTASQTWLHTGALWWLLVPSAVLIATMLKGARDYGYLVHDLSEHPLTLPTELARLRLRPLVGWGIATGFGWTFGLTLLIFLFGFIPAGSGGTPHGVGLIAPIAFMTFVALWGAYYLVLSPQFGLHKALQGAKISLLQACAQEIWPSAPGHNDPAGRAAEHIRGLLEPKSEEAERVMRELTSEPEWVYPAPGELLLFATQVILPLIAFVVSLSLRG